MAEMCGNCRNYLDSRGICRAHPPTAKDDGSARWPSVSRSDWCGEYKVVPPPVNQGLRKLASA
ncbi:hypothetical protein [Phreatobacter oligotrophus]|uniref:Uncharacterized protein n=1 Tax=Phreatobacter oligotrophus TaxID=1122261 RepID=A0A2T4ZFY8_9HYPH|nr:hypothetical protein [Phreatobacter oligotrophus]PTM60819.1 hypothetical protein C8P69_102202 [Phreatobacter oligotrophus]